MALADVVHVGSWRERRRERDAADERIQRSSIVPAQLSWRAAELTSPYERRLLADSLRGVVADLSPSWLPVAAPLNRVALRPHSDLLLRLADRLDDLERPVAARGILEVQWLLIDPSSPLYGLPDDDDEPEDVRKATIAALDLLDPGR
jgi:hypothetical protein